MNILILAYASEPGAGSEYGVGWMVPTIMAKRHPEHEIYVLTRSRCREKISPLQPPPVGEAINTPERCDVMPNLHFLFCDVPSWLYYKKEMGSNWGEQYNYLMWQWFAKRYIREVRDDRFFASKASQSAEREVRDDRLEVRDGKFDVIHHLTFNQYRTPSPGFFIDVPFVMGPIGGAETIADAFYQDLTEHTAKKERFRKKGRDLKLFGWWMRRKKNKKVILCSTNENVERLKPHCGENECRFMPAIAYTPDDFAQLTTDKADDNTPFTLIYAGKAFDWKGIRIFLRAAKKGYIDNGIKDFLIKLIGIRSEQEQQTVMGWVKEEGLVNNVELIPFIARADLLKELAKCNLSVYPAFRDSGSMSVLEASALACPTICFDAGGQDAFPDEVLLKIGLSPALPSREGEYTYEELVIKFSEKLAWAYNNQEALARIGQKAKEYVSKELVWEKKVDDFVRIYERVGG